ncbi:MAG: SsrA-binding protein SmpB [Rhodospirillaceae bacterium]|mgnify:CR=1 FL=1|nr:SsrA-binding protein SmpB [Rhodospirillaceae bacterium]
MARADAPTRVAAQNRKARFNFEIEERIEAGIILTGTEVKSLRGGRASIGEAFAVERDGELYLVNAHIPEYAGASRNNHAPMRPRKLLVHRREMERLLGSISREGMTIVPLSIYFNDRGIAKVQLGLARGRRKVDKREELKRRDWDREKARALRNRNKA